MRDKPIYLNLFQFAFPITAIVSILHRMSGLVLFILIPLFLGMLQNSLFVYGMFEQYRNSILGTPMVRFMIWVGVSALIYHLFAGIRHLCMDMGFGESKTAARISSYLVLLIAILCSIFFGYRLC